MKLEVTADTFGTYKKGDQFEVHESTGKALIAHKVVKEVKEDKK